MRDKVQGAHGPGRCCAVFVQTLPKYLLSNQRRKSILGRAGTGFKQCLSCTACM